jgi:Arc/MetJ family transcription regulator
MRTTLDLPEDIVEEARRLLGFKSKTDTVIVSLRELIRRRRIEELKNLAGRIDLKIDLAKSRRRVGRTGR